MREPTTPQPISEEARRRRHEVTDLPVRPFLFLVGLLAASTVVVVVLVGLFIQGIGSWFSTADKTGRGLPQPMSFPEPRLQLSPSSEMREYTARMTRELNNYGWIDRKAGVVRLPIERAMELLVERGVPVRPSELGPTELELQQQKAARPDSIDRLKP
jgi:hypothetical protein